MATVAGWDRRRTTRWTYRVAALSALLLLIAVLPPSSPVGVVLPLATELVTMAIFLAAVMRKAPTTRLVWWLLWTSQTQDRVCDAERGLERPGLRGEHRDDDEHEGRGDDR